MSKFKKGDYATPKVATDFYVNGEAYGIVNGDIGIVTDIHNYEVTVKFNDFMELTFYEEVLESVTSSDSDLAISLSKLREVLEKMASEKRLRDYQVDNIINRIKQELK